MVENETSCSKNNIQSSFLNTKNNEAIDVKNIKTMFAEMKNDGVYSLNSIDENQNIDSKNEKQNKLQNLNSFFSRKLEGIAPIKNQENNKLTIVLSPSVNSINLSTKNLEVISPSKIIQNDTVETTITQSPDSFFMKKLKIVSPLKHQTNQLPITEDSVEGTPTTLLCEKCNKLIDINQYDEHIDFHVAVELSKSINATQIVQPTNNIKSKSETSKNKCNKKRKFSKSSDSNSKKPCTSILTYFKPILNP